MTQVVTIKEMREIEKKTFVMQNISPFDLMKKVGHAIYKTFSEQYKKKHIMIIAGTGNNGGDALVFGQQAFSDGKQVDVILIGDQNNQSNESIIMTKQYQEQNISLTFVNDYETFLEQVHKNSDNEIIIDGLFGIGLTRNITGLHEKVIHWINNQKITVVSIDVPSGLNSETGRIMGVCIKANTTYTIEAIKQGMLLSDAMDVVGQIIVIDVGMEKIKNKKYYIDTFHGPKKRVYNTHKYDYKNVLTIGGQKGVMGAITLAGYSALVSGAGLSTIAYHLTNEKYLINPYPEIMYESIESITDLPKLIKKKDAILYGLGIREINSFEEMVFDYITDLEIPIVLDAAGMLLLKKTKDIHNKRVIITPHYGEFAKLMNSDVEELKDNLLEIIDRCIHIYHCEIVLKGPSTIYATKDKIIYLNQGTPALAKAGSGDVLSGIILTYLARNLDIEQGILLHMLSARQACKEQHMESVLAHDIIHAIPFVYKKYDEQDE
ncbi:MAG: NAD(P)H-hydrate dehydratase [Acholeplasmataceae bacterium]|nr:NAD(P)H-hydrate dehydratase [Acholeplasmataceae bacterium]